MKHPRAQKDRLNDWLDEKFGLIPAPADAEPCPCGQPADPQMALLDFGNGRTMLAHPHCLQRIEPAH